MCSKYFSSFSTVSLLQLRAFLRKYLSESGILPVYNFSQTLKDNYNIQSLWGLRIFYFEFGSMYKTYCCGKLKINSCCYQRLVKLAWPVFAIFNLYSKTDEKRQNILWCLYSSQRFVKKYCKKGEKQSLAKVNKYECRHNTQGRCANVLNAVNKPCFKSSLNMADNK